MSKSLETALKVSKRKELENTFLFWWRTISSNHPQREYRFCQERKFRYDFAWVKELVAVEVQGGIFIRGGHNRPMIFQSDCEKSNLAILKGWRVFKFTTLDIRKRPLVCAQMVLNFMLDAKVAPSAANP